MKADTPTMNAYGLYYDYANMTLPEVIQAYAKEYGIKNSQIAFSYKNLATGELIEMNETQPMTAGSTYKLPLNMLVVDNFEKYNLSMTNVMISLTLTMSMMVNTTHMLKFLKGL